MLSSVSAKSPNQPDSASASAEKSALQTALKAVLEAGAKSDCETVRQILQAMPPDARDKICRGAIPQIGKRNEFQVVQLLVESVSDPSVREQCCCEAVTWAAVGNNETMIFHFMSLVDGEDKKLSLHYNAIYGATIGGHLNLVEQLLAGVTDIPVRDQYCNKALQWAVNLKQWPIVEHLTGAITDIDLRHNWYYKASQSAVKFDDWRFGTRMMEVLTDLTVRDKWCIEALGIATRKSNLEFVSWLLEAFSGSESRQTGCCKALLIAAKVGNTQLSVKLVEHIQTPPVMRHKCCFDAVCEAATRGHWELVDQLILAVGDNEQVRDQCTSVAAIWAADRGKKQQLMQYLTAIDSLDVRRKCCLEAVQRAARAFNWTVVDLIIDSAASSTTKNQCRQQAIVSAATHGSMEIVSSLLESIDEQDIKAESSGEAVSLAIKGGHWQLVEQLLQAFPHIVPDFRESSVLHFLANEASNGRHSIANVLAERQSAEQSHELLFHAIVAGHVSLSAALLPHQSDINRQDQSGRSALILAAHKGQDELIRCILGCPGVQLEMQDAGGLTALSMASAGGHARAVMTLLNRGANHRVRDKRGRSCLQLATEMGHADVIGVLMQFKDCNEQDNSSTTPKPTSLSDGQIRTAESADIELSLALHQILTDAGFTMQRAMFQFCIADFLQAIAIYIAQDDRQMTGSYAEGWGNSLVQVNGRTAADSDIDWTIMLGKQVFHLEDGCVCPGVTDRIQVIEGHAQLKVPAGNQPALATAPCGVRPAQDTCYAYECCSTFCDDRVKQLLPYYKSFSRTVHLVRATRPNEANELRVSFSFYEKPVLRSLRTVQGQLFILLKFVLKRLLPKLWNTPGLKTYNAKTLMFFMLLRRAQNEKDRDKDWSPDSLISLLKEALDMMLQFLEQDNRTDVCMPHFFMPSAPLYFKNAGMGQQSELTKPRVQDRLVHLRQNLGELLQLVGSHVQPLQSQSFYFHPFTLLPLTTDLTDLSHIKDFPYPDVYRIIHQCLLQLQTPDCDRDVLLSQISLLPRWCSTAQLSLAVMTYLKFADVALAKELLQEFSHHRVQRGWDCSGDGVFFHSRADSPPDEDWAWRFCFAQTGECNLSFLSEFCQSLLSVRGNGLAGTAHMYVNFRSLWWAFQAELLPQSLPLCVPTWCEELTEDPDLEELLTVARYSTDRQQLEFCLHQMLIVTSGKSLEACDEEKICYLQNRVKRAES